MALTNKSFKFGAGMKVFEKYYYKLDVILSLVGQWPYQDPKARFLYRFVISFLYLSFLEVQIMKMFTSDFNVDLLVETLPIVSGTMLSGTKYVRSWIQIEIIKRLLEEIQNDWRVLKNRNEVNILKKHINMATMYEIFYIISASVSVFVFWMIQLVPIILDIVIPLNDSRPYHIPFKAEYFFDEQKYLYLIMLHMNVSVIIVITTLVASEIIAITIVIHACGILSILGYRLEHSFDDINPRLSNSDIKSIYSIRIIECIKYHIKIIKYIHMIKHFYTLTAVVQLFLGVTTLIVVLLQLFQNLLSNNYGKIIMSCLCVAAAFIGLFITILPAQKLLDYSSNIHHKVYCGHWYYAPVPTQKLVLLLMQRAKEPCTIKFAGILTASFELFVTITQTSLSYFTILYSIR